MANGSFSVKFQNKIKSMHLLPNLMPNHAHLIWNINWSNSKTKKKLFDTTESRKLQPKCSFFIKALLFCTMFMFHVLFWAVSEIMALRAVFVCDLFITKLHIYFIVRKRMGMLTAHCSPHSLLDIKCFYEHLSDCKYGDGNKRQAISILVRRHTKHITSRM